MAPRKVRRSPIDRGAILLLMAVGALGGCATARLPLCPDIAVNSYPGNQEQHSSINWFALNRARENGLSISYLSHFVAEFRGGQQEIDDFRENYKWMLCAFDPARELRVESQYTTCMRHAERWIDAVEEREDGGLMADAMLFRTTCASRGSERQGSESSRTGT